MINLAYKIDFEIVAFLFTVLLYIEMRINYPIRTGKNKAFRNLMMMVIVTEAFDLVSAVTNAYAVFIPNILNMLVNSGYFTSGLFLCYMFQYYIEVGVIAEEKKSLLLKINKYILLCVEAAVVINIPFGYFFYFSPEGIYERGGLYLIMHLVSLWFVLCASVILFINRSKIEKKRMISSVAFVSVYFVSVFCQTFVFPHVLIIMPAVSAMLVIAIFSLESPDYLKLQDALKELTETKNQLEEANKKYYNLAYTDLMTGLKNRSAYNMHLEQLSTGSNKEKIIFLIADINALKYLNDNLGHMIGDDAIEKAAKLLKRNFGEGCQCYRIGGDEFAVIGYDISEKIFEENYCRLVEEIKAEAKQSTYKFSVAIGYQRTGAFTIREALKKADEKMYANKLRMKRQDYVS